MSKRCQNEKKYTKPTLFDFEPASRSELRNQIKYKFRGKFSMKASTLALGMKVNLGSTRHQVLRFPFNTRTGTASYVRYINTKVFYGLSMVDTAFNTVT